jgi:hypothetical protein
MKDSTVTFNTAVTATTIVLDDSGLLGRRKLSLQRQQMQYYCLEQLMEVLTTEGSIQITGATKTFSGTIGAYCRNRLCLNLN